MTIKNKIAFGIFFFNAAAMLVIGLVYQFSNEFMPYHSAIIQTEWVNLSEAQKILYLGMMRTEAAGFLASGTAILLLLFIPYLNEERWAPYAITAIGIVEYLPSAIATFNVAQSTNASPPWIALFTGIALLIVALAINDFKKPSASSVGGI